MHKGKEGDRSNRSEHAREVARSELGKAEGIRTLEVLQQAQLGVLLKKPHLT